MSVSSASNNFNSSFDYLGRANELKEKVQNLKQKLQIRSNIDLSFLGFESAHANLRNKTIGLPSWVLLKHGDIPSRFLVHSINDPRLTDKRFLNEFATWINEKLKSPSLPTVCNPDGALQRLILLLRDRNLFEKSKDFLLSHELGHLSYDGERNFALGIITIGVVAIVVSLVAIPVIHLVVGLTGVGIAFVITALGVSRLPGLSQIEKEKKADLDAVTVLDDADGGIYYFETELMFNRRLRLQGGEHLLDLDKTGNFLGDKEHPLLSDRVGFLQQWKNERNKTTHHIAAANSSNLQHRFCKV